MVFELRVLCLGRILTSKSLTQKQGRAATVAALDLHACSSRPAVCLQQACCRRVWQPTGRGAAGQRRLPPKGSGACRRRAATRDACRRCSRGRNPPTGAAARRDNIAYGGSDARRGSPPTATAPPASVPPAGEGSALAPPHRPPPAGWRRRQQRKGERVLGFSGQKIVLPLRI